LDVAIAPPYTHPCKPHSRTSHRMSGAELSTVDYLNAYSGHEARSFISGVLKQMDKMEKRGKYGAALEYCETQMLYSADIYGQQSPQTWELCERFAATSNALAVAAVQQSSYSQPTKLLRRALAVLRRCSGRTDPKQLLVTAVTLNNLGTHYRRTNRLRASLSCISKAVALNPLLEHPGQCADTHINISSTMQRMESHSEAAEHAAQAIALLRLEVQELATAAAHSDAEELRAEWQQRSGVLAVCIYNHGVSLEQLRLYGAALKAFREAARVCQSCFGHDHPTTVAMESSYRNALENMEDYEDYDVEEVADFHSRELESVNESLSSRHYGTDSVLEADEFVFDDDEASDSETALERPMGDSKTKFGRDDELDDLLDLMPQYSAEWEGK